MIAYLIKSTVCLLLLLLLYHAFLERETMHRFNRFFLIFSLVFGFTIPLLTLNIGGSVKLSDQINEINNRLDNKNFSVSDQVPAVKLDPAPAPTQAAPENTTDYPNLFWVIYLFGVLIFLVRLLRNLYTLYSKISVNAQTSWKSATLVLTDDGSKPHSFFNYIFIDQRLYRSGNISQTILTHEFTHSRQKHSLDILLIELLKIAFWFNPVLYFYKRAIQANHEYLADASVIKENDSIKNYQELLLNMKSPNENLFLASSITFSLTKKRIMMMTKRSARWIITGKKLALIPILAGLIFAFSTHKTTAQTVRQMSLTELINAVSERMDAVDSLTDTEQQQLRSLVSKMQKKLRPEAPPPPPPPVNKTDKPEKTLNKIIESYKEQVKYYNGIRATEANVEKLNDSYEKVMSLYRTIKEYQNKISDNPPPPPKPAPPAERIAKDNSKSQSIANVADRNLLKIFITRQGLILMDEEPTPLSKTKAKVKAFITNNGTNPELSDSPQDVYIRIKTVKETPYKFYTELLDNVQHAYLEVRNTKAQAEYGVDYQKLVENSPAKTKIREMYPVRISIADPQQNTKEKYAVPDLPEQIADRNLLEILVNWEGLILADKEPIPIDKLTATVKKFITNNRANPKLSDSSQDAIVSLKLSEKTPAKIQQQAMDQILAAYKQAKDESAQADFGMEFDRLEEGSAEKKRIDKMYPARISIEMTDLTSPDK
ncbi:MAG: M56 family metallopeptidase [Balneolaceae bacterium]|nr:M56 family metallopeptidase [Balneolaceae bacterium]